MQACSRVARERSKGFVKKNISPPPTFAIVERTRRNGTPKHFFQTKRLRAELDFICPVIFRLSPLVFHGNDCPR